MGQGSLDAIAGLKAVPWAQHSVNFGVSLRHNIPQESGSFGVGLSRGSAWVVKHGKYKRTENACPCKAT